MSHADPTAMAAGDASPTKANPLPTLHLVDGDGIITKPDNIVEFLNCEVAGVSSAASPTGSLKINRLNLSVSSDVSAAASNFCHQYIRQVVGLRYHVVGVFGGQSSGKSTLLNSVFGTSFMTMNAEEGRHQTTKGAFMSVTTSQPGHLDNVPEAVEDEEGNMPVPRPSRPTPPLTDPLLVVDFEGTDGAERGEDQSLERHLSLFALSIADTLIVNMWTTEVGRFNGANLSLLRTVFEVNLQLFSHDHNLDKERPTLLFVMRDSTNPAHFTKNCDRVRASIDKIWETIHKPDLPTGGGDGEVKGDSIERFFNIKFFAFPHYELQRADFIEHVKKFRAMFIAGDGADSCFNSPSSFRGIPLEAVPHYLNSCWESILKSKDLDIPTQREMLSRFRCKDLVDEKVRAYKSFTAQICERMADRGDITLNGKIRTNDGKGGKHTLQELLQSEFDMLVAQYTEESKLYAPRVVSDHRDRLQKELLEAYNSTVKAQCGVIIKEVMRNLEGDVQELVDGIIRTHIWQNTTILRTAELPLGAPAEGATADAAATKDVSREEVLSIVRSFWKALCDGTRSMARSISTSDDGVQRQLLGRCYPVVQADIPLQEMVASQLNVAVASLIKKRLETMSADAGGAMHKTFEYVLNHNLDGSLKLFSTPEGLQKQFRPARFAGLVLAACLFYSRMEVKEHATSMEAMLHGDDDEALEDEDDLSNNNKALFARTLSSMTNVSVRFAENEEEKSFYLDLGSAHMSMDKISAFVNNANTASANNRTGAAVLQGSDKIGVSVGYGVAYPNMPVGSATPRFNGKEDDNERDENNEEAEEKDDAVLVSSTSELTATTSGAGVCMQNILITRSSLRRALQLFHQQIYFTFQVQLSNVEAKAKGAHIPIGMWVALAYFAHDEIFYILRSPVLLILCILAGYFFFSAFVEAKWKVFEESGPPVVVAFVRQAIHMAKPYVDGIKDQLKPLHAIGNETATVSGNATSTGIEAPAGSSPCTPATGAPATGANDEGVRRRKPNAIDQ